MTLTCFYQSHQDRVLNYDVTTLPLYPGYDTTYSLLYELPRSVYLHLSGLLECYITLTPQSPEGLG